MAVPDTEAVGLSAYRALFERSPDGVLFADANGRISAANPSACSLVGLSAEEVCRLGHDGIVDPDDPRWRLVVAERDRTGSATGVVRVRCGDGRFVEIEMTSQLYHDESASPSVLTILRDVTSRVAIEHEIEELSARLVALTRGDELTGLANRRGLIVTGSRLLQVADRHGAEVTALFVDVGNVSELNERHGHEAGDAALQAVARALSVTFRAHDVLARVGGTGFFALALNLPEADRTAIAGRITDHLDAPETASLVGAGVDVAFGWALRQPGERSSLEDLMARSDWAMLEARDAGRVAGPATGSTGSGWADPRWPDS
jgi:diguanylate cyclase (GGDEF)-like protein/PAS domain S-box-containing protein